MYTDARASQLFDIFYHGATNFITPHIIERAMITPKIAYELSSGRGIMDNTIYGVTVLIVDDRTGNIEHSRKLSHCFHSRDEARAHVRSITERYY